MVKLVHTPVASAHCHRCLGVTVQEEKIRERETDNQESENEEQEEEDEERMIDKEGKRSRGTIVRAEARHREK